MKMNGQYSLFVPISVCDQSPKSNEQVQESRTITANLPTEVIASLDSRNCLILLTGQQSLQADNSSTQVSPAANSNDVQLGTTSKNYESPTIGSQQTYTLSSQTPLVFSIPKDSEQPSNTSSQTTVQQPVLIQVAHENPPLISKLNGAIVYVNPKQYGRILKRRVERSKLENGGRIPQGRRKYLHESRHKHAMTRVRGHGGKFDSSTKADLTESDDYNAMAKSRFKSRSLPKS